MKMEMEDSRVVQTTSCPISTTSPFISCVIGTLDTATGVTNTATKVAKCAPVNASRKKRYATPIPKMGANTVRMRIPITISFFMEVTVENSNCAPRAINARGVERLDS